MRKFFAASCLGGDQPRPCVAAPSTPVWIRGTVRTAGGGHNTWRDVEHRPLVDRYGNHPSLERDWSRGRRAAVGGFSPRSHLSGLPPRAFQVHDVKVTHNQGRHLW
jgi:hypothetical protein